MTKSGHVDVIEGHETESCKCSCLVTVSSVALGRVKCSRLRLSLRGYRLHGNKKSMDVMALARVEQETAGSSQCLSPTLTILTVLSASQSVAHLCLPKHLPPSNPSARAES